jgi:hypothetical protein
MTANRFRIALAALPLVALHAFGDLLMATSPRPQSAGHPELDQHQPRLFDLLPGDQRPGQGARPPDQAGQQGRWPGRRQDGGAHPGIADPNVIALAGYLNTPGLVELMKRNVLVDGKIALVAPSADEQHQLLPHAAGTTMRRRSCCRKRAHTAQARRAGLLQPGLRAGVFKFAEESAKTLGVNIVATAMFRDRRSQDRASIASTADTVAKADPDAVIVTAAGAGAFNSSSASARHRAATQQLYAPFAGRLVRPGQGRRLENRAAW